MNTRPIVKFNSKNQPEFFSTVRHRVQEYFEDQQISKKANLEMKIKTVFMISLYVIPFILILTGVVQSFWAVLSMWVLMGFGMSGIGLSVMHDANHGAYSKNETVNSLLGFLINFIGANDSNWRIQHNLLHHSFTNINEFDGDIENPIMRFSPDQPFNKKFKYQAFYAPFLYSLMTLYWFISKDFQRIITYHKKDLLGTQNLNLATAWFFALLHKLWYIGLIIVLPILVTNIPWWYVIIGFFVMHGITGLLLALIFQPAHVIEETEFFEASDQGTVENNWAIHQMKTTANFANDARAFSWFIGGLNYQIEHHLFPKVCHVHYRKMSKIVKKTAMEFGIPYHQHPTFYQAVRSHFSVLHQLGTGTYEKKLGPSLA